MSAHRGTQTSIEADAQLERPKPKPGFTLNSTGFLVTFANGYGLSVQWSRHHMCSIGQTDPSFEGHPHSYTVECLEETPTGNGKLHGHCSPEYVLKLLRKMERRQTDAERAMARECRIQNRQHSWRSSHDKVSG